jgi:hypothetical protein
MQRGGAVVLTSFEQDRLENRDLVYWRTRTPEERLAAVEFLRRQHVGAGTRLRRILRVVDRSPR